MALGQLREEGMKVEARQDVLLDLPEEDIKDYGSVFKTSSAAYKRAKTTKGNMAEVTKTDDIVHNASANMVDGTAAQTIGNTMPAQSYSKLSDSVSAISVSSVSANKRDETALYNTL